MSLAERNPLRCAGTALPVGVSIMVKVIAIWMAFALFDLPWMFRAAALACIAALLLNVHPRIASFALGAVYLLAILPGNGVNPTAIALGCLLLLAGLYRPRFARLPRTAPAVLNLAAAVQDSSAASGALDWAIVTLRFALAALLLAPRWISAAIWMAVLFETATALSGREQIFLNPILAALPALVHWPQPMLVIYDGDCAICTRIRRWWERIDFDGLFTWTPLQSEAAARSGIPKQRLTESLHLVAGETVTRGFRACKRMLMYHPAAWLILGAAAAIPGPRDSNWYRSVAVAGAILFFLPLTEPVGEKIYRWIASNRHRLASGGACAADGNRPP
jgi:predicted DCC family thiol-disulfide oxidoreductase YuxK